MDTESGAPAAACWAEWTAPLKVLFTRIATMLLAPFSYARSPARLSAAFLSEPGAGKTLRAAYPPGRGIGTHPK